MVLQDCLLAKLDSMLLLEFLDESLQELLLGLHLYYTSLDLHRDALLCSSLLHLVPTHLSE